MRKRILKYSIWIVVLLFGVLLLDALLFVLFEDELLSALLSFATELFVLFDVFPFDAEA